MNSDRSLAGEANQWWTQAVVYQVYPRSFKDTTGSGEGDLPGIASKIPYLNDLGVQAIWISPFYTSEMADGGYDVENYRDVDPRFGTVEDFRALTEVAHAAGIRVIVDIVPNHTSHRHPWFREALASKPGSAARDRYIFREGRGENGDLPPTTWESHFGGPAWTRVPDGQWYLHLFAKEQPDLNWENRSVRDDFLETIRFWANCGADGFRVDMASAMAKDLDRDDLDEWSAVSDVELPHDGRHPLYDRNEVHEIFREWRQVFNEYNPPLFGVAEAWVQPDRLHFYASSDELGQTFNFELTKVDWIRDDIHKVIDDGVAMNREYGSSPTWVLSNHDVPRHVTRYGLPQLRTPVYHQVANDFLLRDGRTYFEDRERGEKRARAALLMEMALPGSAYVYQGEELGLPEVATLPWDELDDPRAFNTEKSGRMKGRDGCRVPLPWVASDIPVVNPCVIDGVAAEVTGGEYGSTEYGHGGSFGFSPRAEGALVTDPFLRQPVWFARYGADAQDKDARSMLNFYRKTLRLRSELMPTDLGFEWLPEDVASDGFDGANGYHGGVVAYRRSNGWANVTNFGRQPIDLPAGEVVWTSGPLTEDGKLPQDTSAWLVLAS